MQTPIPATSTADPARLPRGGLGRRTTLLTFLSTSLLALAMSGITLYWTYSQARQRTEEDHRITLEWSAERLGSWLSWALAELEEVARSEGRERRRGGGAPEPSATQRLKARLPGAQAFSGLMLLDPEGNPRAWAGSAAELRTLRTLLPGPRPGEAELHEVMRRADLRRELTAHAETSVQAFDLGGTTPALVASTPLRDAEGRPGGSLLGVLRREELATQLRGEALENAGSVALVDASGGLLVVAGDASAESVHPPHREWLRPGAGTRARFFWSAEAGWVAASARPLGLLDWTLVVQQCADDAFAPLLLAVPAILTPAALLILLFTSLGSVVGARTMKPLAPLYAAMRRVAKGDFDALLPAYGAPGEFGAVFNAFNTMTSQLRDERDRCHAQLRALTDQNQAFQKQHDVLSRLSITDGLTELNNHRYFQDQLRREIKRLTRTGQGLSMLLIDIDDFKQLNDQFGHAAGDEFLKQLAQILKESVRETDLLARYGGEEFVIVATNTNPKGASTLAEKLRSKIAETSFIVDSTMRPRRMTISIGLASYKESRTELFASADAALYRAKAAGKNCVVCADRDERAS